MKSVSCLVVSKSYRLLNSLLDSLEKAKLDWTEMDEVLCSWNGSSEDELKINNLEGLYFEVCHKAPYHFAKNINALARKAKGDYILIVNDDVVLDRGSIDELIMILERDRNIGIVGGLLRTSKETLSHAGVLFNFDLEPYNRCRPEFGARISLENDEVKRSGQITAVTGALMMLRKDDLVEVPMRESFSNCCEDIALCLDVLGKKNKVTYYSSDVTAIHDEKSTRGQTDDAEDFALLKKIFKLYKDNSPQLLHNNMLWQAYEGQWLRNQFYRGLMDIQKYELLIPQKDKLIKKQKDDLITLDHNRKLLIAGQRALEKRIDEMHASMSWKITGPMRYLMSKIHQRTGK